jgi:ABC-type phosphate/phosphonate transport system substrate-binding protein
MVNWLGANNTAVPTDTASIVAGLYISKPPITSFNGVNLANSNAAHPLMNCRLYYSQIIVQPEKSIKYIEQNRNKKVVYRTFCSGMYPNIAASSTFIKNKYR